MNNTVAAQYSTGLSQHNIEQALIAAGKDLEHLQPADLGLAEDFHTMGRYATSQLLDLLVTMSHEHRHIVGVLVPDLLSTVPLAACWLPVRHSAKFKGALAAYG